MTTSIMHHLKERGASTMCRMCRVAHRPGKHVKGEAKGRHERKRGGNKAAPQQGMNPENPESVGIAQRSKKRGSTHGHQTHHGSGTHHGHRVQIHIHGRHAKKRSAHQVANEKVGESSRHNERGIMHKEARKATRTGAMPYRHGKKRGLKLNPPSKGHKPKGAHGKAAVHALGRTKTTGNFKKIEKAKGKGAAINAYQKALKAHKAGKARKRHPSLLQQMRSKKRGSGEAFKLFKKHMSRR